MSKKVNVNPDHYKTAGRERPGDDIVHEIHKQKFTQAKVADRVAAKKVARKQKAKKSARTKAKP